MKLSVRVRSADAAPSEVLVEADESATVANLLASVSQSVGLGSRGLWVDGARLADDARLADVALRQGSTLALDPVSGSTPDFTPPRSGWQLHVVAGPDAGTIVDLPAGRHELGRQGIFAMTDRSASRRHAVLDVSAGGATITDLGSANGTAVDGQAAPRDGEGEPLRVELGQMIALGDSLLCIREAAAADAPVQPGPDGTVEFTRPPRLRPGAASARIELPSAPEARRARKIPWIAVVAPLFIGVAMAVLMKQPTYLLFAILSPVMAVGNVVSDRRSSAKDHKEAMQAYQASFASTSKRLEDALLSETDRRRLELPDPAAALLMATLPGRRIWERRRRDDDFLTLRVGVADLPSTVEVDGRRHDDSVPTGPRTLYSVPAPLDLREAGVVGLAGPEDVVDGLARWAVLQLSLLHAPRDLGLTLLTQRQRDGWSWYRWLPQAAPADPDSCVASIGNDPTTVAARIAELSELVRARKAAVGSARPDRSHFRAQVVVIDDARSMRAVQGLAQVLTDGPDVGVFSICIGEEDRFLPEECTAVVAVDRHNPAYVALRRNGHPDLKDVIADQVTLPYADVVARALAPLRDVSPEEGEVALPDSARLLDVLGLEPPTVDAIRARWMLGGRSTTMALGVGTKGTFSLDLRRDGPHGLVAGTTGSGKSEFLQSMIASLAVANRPDEMNFVLVDYKGGSAFKDCVHLPHTVGMVTDLDAHLVERAIVSLSAELKRREHILAAAGVKDLEDYIDAKERGADLAPLPRLLIVIDEFASMARELPDFVTGLVNIAQRGRSLGIHLILATQRPSGVVSPEIRANTNLRIALRVTDAGDSTDVIDANDASKIPKSAPGRGFARLGHGALEPFQSGRIGGRRPGARPTVVPPPFVAEVAWGQLGYKPPAPARPVIEESADTDLAALVSAVVGAASEEGIAPQPSPWLDALPERLLLDGLGDVAPEGAELTPIPFGREDLPAAQAQRPAAFDLAGGHLLVIGSSRSGRSQLLRTLAASAARNHSSGDVHLYGLDCGNGALLPMARLPHCGAVVVRGQNERASRLLARLAAEMERRQALLAAGGYSDITEQRRGAAAEDRLPHILFLLDRWEAFTTSLGELDNGKPLDTVLAILREGGSVGVHAVIAGDRTLASGRTGSLCDNKLVLRLADKGDYSYVGLNPRQMPDRIPPGRGYLVDPFTELQIALLDPDDSGQAQAAALEAIAAEAAERDAGVPRSGRAFRVDELPARVDYADAVAMATPPADGPAPRLFALVGVGGDELHAVGPDLGVCPAFVVAGPARSGRSTALSVMARSLLEAGADVIAAASRPSALRDLPGLRSVVTDPATSAEHWRDMLGTRDDRPLVVVFDDGETFKDSPAGDLFKEIMRGHSRLGTAVILGGSADSIASGFSGWQIEAKAARQGLLLSPQAVTDGELIGIRLARSAIGGAVQPGRGLIHLGDTNPTVVAIPVLQTASR